ncbi:hypothetical protein GGR54DRAFT_621776 [Hypoxylon sp. NC1633]|nr:hypothetical protein GGR54DRAFT_621776 [Hypoxylon sp. NC1633]
MILNLMRSVCAVCTIDRGLASQVTYSNGLVGFHIPGISFLLKRPTPAQKGHHFPVNRENEEDGKGDIFFFFFLFSFNSCGLRRFDRYHIVGQNVGLLTAETQSRMGQRTAHTTRGCNVHVVP